MSTVIRIKAIKARAPLQTRCNATVAGRSSLASVKIHFEILNSPREGNILFPPTRVPVVPSQSLAMPNDPSEIRRSLVAERRNLLVTSFVLFFYEAAELRIERINLFGNEVALSDPWWVWFSLWTLGVYFFLRYLQYYMATSDTGASNAYTTWMTRISRRLAFRRFKKSFVPDSEFAGFRHSFLVRETELLMMHPDLWSLKLEISVAHTKKEGDGGSERRFHTENVTSARLLWAKIKAVICVVLLTQVGTEYFLPFIVALLPLLPLGARLYRIIPFSILLDAATRIARLGA